LEVHLFTEEKNYHLAFYQKFLFYHQKSLFCEFQLPIIFKEILQRKVYLCEMIAELNNVLAPSSALLGVGWVVLARIAKNIETIFCCRNLCCWRVATLIFKTRRIQISFFKVHFALKLEQVNSHSLLYLSASLLAHNETLS